MEKEKIYTEVIAIAQNVFKDDSLRISRETSSKDVFLWNSLNHVVLIEAIEKHFDIRFDLDTMLEIETIGDICNHLEKTVNSK
jgi:acyl carrier protein